MNSSPTPAPPGEAPPPIFAHQVAPKKRSGWKTFFKGVGLTTLVSVAGAGIYLNFTVPGQKVRDGLIKAVPIMVTIRTDPDLLFEHAGSDTVNILLIGRDVNWKIGKVFDPHTGTYRPYQVHDESANARSDTMIVVSMNKTDGTVRMVSLPRDSIVRIPGHGRTKLNAAHAFGGPDLLLKTLHDELGLTIQHYAVIKFDGFKKLIDKMGGVQVNVDGALKLDRRTNKLYRGDLDYDDNWGNLHVHLKPGVQMLNGDQAHGYIRFREDREGDPGRIRRQQQVMKALAKGITQQSIPEIPGLIDEIKKQFKTDMSDDEMASAGWFSRSAGAEQKLQPLTLFAVETPDGNLTLNKPKNKKLLAYIFGPTFNPDNFLMHSPSTRGDDIGPTNNAGPEALKVLRAAGVLDKDATMPDSPTLEAPQRGVKPPGANPDSTQAEADPSTPTDSRFAEGERPARDFSTRDSAPVERPRRHRRARDLSTQTAPPEVLNLPNDISGINGPDPHVRRRKRTRRRDAAARRNEVTRRDNTAARDESAPAASNAPQSVEESPIPQPE